MFHANPGHESEITVDLLVSGMHCASCVALIEEVVADIAGVSSVRVDLDRAASEVRFDPGVVTADQLCAVIGDLGYQASVDKPTN